MSETPRLHSVQSKEKISSSLKKIWAERLKMKHLKEKFYYLWEDSISEAARLGGINEDELNWDSYERANEEIALQQLQWAAEKAIKKEMKRIQSEKRAQAKTEKMACRVRKKIGQKQKVEPRIKHRRMVAGKERTKEVLHASRVSKQEAMSLEHDGKGSTDGPFCNQAGVMMYLQSALERLAIESVKKEQRQKPVSLADQIRAAKNKRMQTVASRTAVTTSNVEGRALGS